MKKIMMVLPFAVLLAYCSGPNNTQQTTDADMEGTTSVAASTTTTDADVATTTTTTTDVSDVNTNTTTVSTTATAPTTTNSGNPFDVNDPMYQHFVKMNGQYWTYDLNYPGYDRPMAGTYNSAINGNWQLQMTPELVSAWKQDNSRSLWSSGYAYDGRFLGGNTYLSASESFNTTNSGLNNNASANSSVANQMNGTAATTGVYGGVTSGENVATTTVDVNSISYNAANGNMYQMPRFNLYLDNGTFTGYTGCNSISGRVSVTGSTLHFENLAPTTNIECMGGLDQNAFLDILHRIDSYAYVGDELQLMQGNQVLLKFKKGNAVQ